MQSRGLNKETIDSISTYIDNLDYTEPLYQNYDVLRNNIDALDLKGSSKASIFNAIKNIDSLNHIDETINNLDDAILKSYMNESVKVYRALKGVPEENLTNMVGKNLNNKGYTSTTPVYDSSFAKYDEYNTVIEMNIPKGTQGIDIRRFSAYDVENEILLNENYLTVFDVKKRTVDKNGKEKNIIKGYVLSKDKSGYAEIYNQEQSLIQNKKEKVWDKIVNKIKSLFSKKDETYKYVAHNESREVIGTNEKTKEDFKKNLKVKDIPICSPSKTENQILNIKNNNLPNTYYEHNAYE